MALKLNIGANDGNTHSKELTDDESKALRGKQIGDTVKGDKFGFSGYEFEITGGSDSAGFPMRWDVEGTQRKKVLLTKGIGFSTQRPGERQRRTVAGNTIGKNTVQVNLKVVKEGSQPLGEAEESSEASGEAEEGGDEPEESQEEAAEEEPAEEESDEAGDEEPEESDDGPAEDESEDDSEEPEEDEEKPE